MRYQDLGKAHQLRLGSIRLPYLYLVAAVFAFAAAFLVKAHWIKGPGFFWLWFAATGLLCLLARLCEVPARTLFFSPFRNRYAVLP